MTATAAVVVLAAGSGSRVGSGVNKVLLPLQGRALIGWPLLAACEVPDVDPVVLVCHPEERPAIEEAVAPLLGEREVLLVDGGDTRHRSEDNALRVLRSRIDAGQVDVVAIHDGARPLAGPDLFARTIETAREHGGAVPTVELPGLWALEPDADLPDRMVGVQTPQAFRAVALLAAYDAARADGFEGTDTAACLSAYADPDGADGDPTVRIRAIPTGPGNLKVTWPEDVATAEELLRGARLGSEGGEDAEVLG